MTYGRDWWATHGWATWLVDAHPESARFNLAAARNLGVRKALEAACDVVIVADADTIVSEHSLAAAVQGALGDRRCHLPYLYYHRVVLTSPEQDITTAERVRTTFGSGHVYVVRPQAWIDIGGQDERFEVWGVEDLAFTYTHQIRARAQMQRYRGDCYSIEHGQDNRGSAEQDAYQRALLNEAKAQAYAAHT